MCKPTLSHLFIMFPGLTSAHIFFRLWTCWALAFGMYGILPGKREYSCIDGCIFFNILIFLGRVELYAFFHGIGFGDKFCEVVFMFTMKHVMLNLACIVLSNLSIPYAFFLPKKWRNNREFLLLPGWILFHARHICFLCSTCWFVCHSFLMQDVLRNGSLYCSRVSVNFREDAL